MDTTLSSVTGGGGVVGGGYVSCIKVDGIPILPPILDDSKRAEMRYYRQLALEREQGRHLSRIAAETAPTTGSSSTEPQSSRPTTASSDPFQISSNNGKDIPDSSEDGPIFLTSTPKKKKDKKETGRNETIIIQNLPKDKELEDIENRLRIRLNFVELAKEEEEDGDEMEEERSGSSSQASAATFTVKKGPRGADSEDEVEGLTDTEEVDAETSREEEERQEPLKTVIRRPNVIATDRMRESSNSTPQSQFSFKRKRPAKYFDDYEEKDSDNENDEQSTSLSKYMGESGRSRETQQSEVEVASSHVPSTISTQTTPTLLEQLECGGDNMYHSEESGPTTPEAEGHPFAASTSKVHHSPPLPAHSLRYGSPQKSVSTSVSQSPSASSTKHENLSTVGLSKFQNKMQHINPSLFKLPMDMRSPLLKGLVFPDPLHKSVGTIHLPEKANDPAMKKKFDRVSAAVKGYLTRRLLSTQKIQLIIQTIRDTVELLLKLYEENQPNPQGLVVIKDEEQDLHHRLVQQLTSACVSFHDVFFKLSIKEKMAIIANDREKTRAKALKNELTRRGGGGTPSISSQKNISSATLKSIERRKTMSNRSPEKVDHRKIKERRRTATKNWVASGSLISNSVLSQSVKPKPVRSHYKVTSPKRRRMTMHPGGNKNNLTTTKTQLARVTNPEENVNEFVNVTPRRPFTAMQVRSEQKEFQPVAYSARDYYDNDNSNNNSNSSNKWNSETFVVPRTDNWSIPVTRRSSARSSMRSSTSTSRPTTATGTKSTTALINHRAPWK